MRVSLLILSYALALLAQVPSAVVQDLPIVMKFVAPAYPWIAKDQRIFGKTRTTLTINRDGFVTDAKTVVAHRVFEDYVLEALKQWRFKPSDHEYALEVTCLFEVTEGKCEGLRPITSETRVSAELPAVVHISTDLPCIVNR